MYFSSELQKESKKFHCIGNQKAHFILRLKFNFIRDVMCKASEIGARSVIVQPNFIGIWSLSLFTVEGSLWVHGHYVGGQNLPMSVTLEASFYLSLKSDCLELEAFLTLRLAALLNERSKSVYIWDWIVSFLEVWLYW